MNISSLSSNKQALTLLITAAVAFVYALVVSQFLLAGIIFVGMIAALFVPAGASGSQARELEERIAKVVIDAADGKLEGRITRIPDDGSTLSSLAWAVNDMLDQVEAFMR